MRCRRVDEMLVGLVRDHDQVMLVGEGGDGLQSADRVNRAGGICRGVYHDRPRSRCESCAQCLERGHKAIRSEERNRYGAASGQIDELARADTLQGAAHTRPRDVAHALGCADAPGGEIVCHDTRAGSYCACDGGLPTAAGRIVSCFCPSWSVFRPAW